MEISRSLHCDWYITKSVNFSGAHLTSWCVFVLIVGPYIPPLEEHRALPRWRQREGNPLPFRNNRILWDLPDFGTIRKRRTAGISVVIYESYRRETDGNIFRSLDGWSSGSSNRCAITTPIWQPLPKSIVDCSVHKIESIACLLVGCLRKLWLNFDENLGTTYKI